MSRITLEIVRGPRPAPGRGASTDGAYVSRRRAEAEAHATALVERAREVADRIVADARASADAIRRDAYEQGLDAGERRWADAALTLAERRAAALENLERDCVHLAVEIARRTVGAELALDGSAIESIATVACAPLRRDAALVLRVGPAHAARVEAVRARLGERREVACEVDPSLGPADCVAECAGVRVDARLDVQLANVERRLLGGDAPEVEA